MWILIQLVWNSHQGLEKDEIKITGVFKAQANHDNPEPMPIWNSAPLIIDIISSKDLLTVKILLSVCFFTFCLLLIEYK